MLATILKYVQMISVGAIALFMLFLSILKLVGFPGMEESFLSWGFPKWVMIVVAIIELILAIAVFAKPTRNAAFIGLILLTTAALYIHYSNYEYEEVGPATAILITSLFWFGYNVLGLEKKLQAK